MKKLFIAFYCVAVVLASCSKQATEAVSGEDAVAVSNDGQIRFAAQDAAFLADSKAATGTSVVSSMDQFYVSCTTGTLGSETQKWTSVSFTGSTLYAGGKYWPHTDEGYHFYASNNPMVFHTDSPTVAAVNSKDVVCAYLPSPVYKEQNTLTFEHIFARIGDVILTAMPTYTITNVSIRIVPKISGTYNVRTGAGWSNGTGWSGTSNGTSTVIANTCPATNTNDVWLIPGEYQLLATWTASKDWNATTNAYDYVRTFTDVAANVNIVGGKVNAITATLGGSAKEIEFIVTIKPWRSTATEAPFPSSNDGRSYLTFSSTGSNTLSYSNYGGNSPTLYYSYNLYDWYTWTAGDAKDFSSSKPLYVCGNNPSGLSTSSSRYSKFSISGSGSVSCGGNIMSLINYSTPPSAIPSDYCFKELFSGCAKLASAPVLPATTLTNGCYMRMFQACTSLTAAPSLPSTSLGSFCYANMFMGCTGLTTAPDLPAKTITLQCYADMFSGCSSLVTAQPILPATNLASSCYARMFQDCTSLTTAPELPATELVNDCYSGMFYNCTSINYIKALFTTTPSNSYTQNWVYRVAASGTFVKNTAASWSVSGVNGIPSGWAVQTAAY